MPIKTVGPAQWLLDTSADLLNQQAQPMVEDAQRQQQQIGQQPTTPSLASGIPSLAALLGTGGASTGAPGAPQPQAPTTPPAGGLSIALPSVDDLLRPFGLDAASRQAATPPAQPVIAPSFPTAPSGTPSPMPTGQPMAPASGQPAARLETIDTSSREANLRGWAPALRDVEARTGLSQRAVAGLIVAENGGGQSPLARENNAYFSVGHIPDSRYQSGSRQADPNLTTGQTRAVGTYRTPQDSLDHFVEVVSTMPRYAKAWAVRNDPERFWQELAAAGYIEPGPHHAQWFTNLRSGAEQYDRASAGVPSAPQPPQPAPTTQARPQAPSGTPQPMPTGGHYPGDGHDHSEDYDIAFGFNQRYTNPFNPNIPNHRGVDLVVKGAPNGGRGMPVRAFRGGTVVAVTRDPNGGNGVILQDDDGLYHRYFHFDSMDVEQGQKIAPGQVIGVLGASGTEGFPHVHFEVSRGINGDPQDKLIDPRPYMKPAPARRAEAQPPAGTGTTTQPLAMASGDESPTAAPVPSPGAAPSSQPGPAAPPPAGPGLPQLADIGVGQPQTQAMASGDWKQPADAMPDDGGTDMAGTVIDPSTRNIVPLGPAMKGREAPYPDVYPANRTRNAAVSGDVDERVEPPLPVVRNRPVPGVVDEGDDEGRRVPMSGSMPVDEAIRRGLVVPTPQTQAQMSLPVEDDRYDPDAGPRETGYVVPPAPAPYDPRTADEGPRESRPVVPSYNEPEPPVYRPIPSTGGAPVMAPPSSAPLPSPSDDPGGGRQRAEDSQSRPPLQDDRWRDEGPREIVVPRWRRELGTPIQAPATPPDESDIRPGEMSMEQRARVARGEPLRPDEIQEILQRRLETGRSRTPAQDAAAIPYNVLEGIRTAVEQVVENFEEAGRDWNDGKTLDAAGNAALGLLNTLYGPLNAAGYTGDEMFPEARILGVGPGTVIANQKGLVKDAITLAANGVRLNVRILERLAAGETVDDIAASVLGPGIRAAAGAVDAATPAISATGRAVGRGARAVAEEAAYQGTFGRMAPATARVVPPSVADTLDFPIRVPDDPSVVRAIEAAGGTVDERGVTLHVTRAQSPSGAGKPATRGMVFYEAVPEGGRSSFVTGSDSPTNVGGTQVIPRTPTRFRSPLILTDAPGSGRGFDEAMRQIHGYDRAKIEAAQRRVDDLYRQMVDLDNQYDSAVKAGRGDEVQAQYDRIVDLHDAAKAELDKMLNVPRESWVDDEIKQARRVGPEGSPARAAALKEVVARYGGEPELIDELLKVRGADASESAWAIKENIVATNARRQGYDGVVTVQARDVPYDELAQHPKVIAAENAMAEANKAEGAAWDALQTLYRGGMKASDPQYQAAYQRYEQASQRTKELLREVQAAEQQARQELQRGQITELADVREAANPTPPSPTAELKAAYQRAKDAAEEVRRLFAQPLPVMAKDLDAATAARVEAQRLAQEADDALDALMNQSDLTPGYTLRSDLPRRAAQGMVPFDPASAAAGAAGGAMTPDEEGEGGDPWRTGVGALAAGILRGRGNRTVNGINARRLAQGVQQAAAAGRNAPNPVPGLPAPPPNAKPGWWDWAQTWRYGVGLFGQLSTAMMQSAGGLGEVALGVPTEAARQIGRGHPEHLPLIAWEGLKSLPAGGKAFGSTAAGKVPQTILQSSDYRPPLSGQLPAGSAQQKAALALETPGRIATQAPDAMWYEVFYRTGLAQAAAEAAQKAGISRFNPVASVREQRKLIQKPTQEMIDRAHELARDATYKGDLGALGTIGEIIIKGPSAQMVSGLPPEVQRVFSVWREVASHLMPVYHTVARITEGGAGFVPGLGLLPPEKIGLAAKPVKLDERLAKQATGTMLTMGLLGYAASGGIRGPGPSDPDVLQEMRDLGYEPNTTNIGGYWVKNQALGRMGVILNTVGAINDAMLYGDGKDSWKDVSENDPYFRKRLGILSNQLGRAYSDYPTADAVKSVLKIGSDPLTVLAELAGETAAQYTPGPVRTIATARDPMARRPDRDKDGNPVDVAVDTFKQRSGIYRQDLPIATNRLGEDVENQRAGWAAIFPRVGKDRQDAVIQAFIDNKVEIPRKRDKITIDGLEIPLTPARQREWQRYMGEFLRIEVPKTLKSNFWNRPTTTLGDRGDELRDLAKEAAEEATGRLEDAIPKAELDRLLREAERTQAKRRGEPVPAGR